MWYFMIKQNDLTAGQYRNLQKKSMLTEVEIFNEPYDNFCLFEVDDYAGFVDFLDVEGLNYQVQSERPTRRQLMDSMQ
ncbi:hypothetical protein [Larkinella soli]|uniref:hypothetical protein n=1 Tax=Larkinella soli TaxID=1770527 RepID=UPI000FFB41CF|nr:hypothetical protein [Larkinella soli]